MGKPLFDTRLRYQDGSGKKFEGPLTLALVAEARKAMEVIESEKVEHEAVIKMIPDAALNPMLEQIKASLGKDKSLRTDAEDMLNRFLKPAITKKFSSKGFGTWKGLSKTTRMIKRRMHSKYPYHPLLQDLYLKHKIWNDWKVKGFRFGEDLRPLGFRISFPKGRGSRHPGSRESYQALIGIHTKGIPETSGKIHGRLPARRVLLTRQEFYTHVWKRFIKEFPKGIKNKFRERAAKTIPVLNSTTEQYIRKILRDFQVGPINKILRTLKISHKEEHLYISTADLRKAMPEIVKEWRGKVGKDAINYAAGMIAAYSGAAPLPEPLRVETRKAKMIMGESNEGT